MKYCILLISVIVFTFSCKSKQMTAELKPLESVVEIEKLAKVLSVTEMLCSHKWTHAREESPEGTALYLNPEGNTFPPSRYRNSFVFNPDGTCQFMYLSPTDRHTMIDGKYSLDADILTILTVDGKDYGVFTMLELSPDRLLLKPMSSNK